MANTLTGTGTISSIGGSTNQVYYSTGGGGGRIAVYYSDISGFSTTNITAYGGTGTFGNGGSGTVYLKSAGQTYGDLIINNNNIGSALYSTPLPAVGTGTITDITADIL